MFTLTPRYLSAQVAHRRPQTPSAPQPTTLPLPTDFHFHFGISRRTPSMRSIRSRMSALSALRTSPLESDPERPPSPGGSSITTNRSKKNPFSFLRPKAKRASGVLTRQHSFDSPAGIAGAADSSSHPWSLPVGDDSTSTTLPQPSEGSPPHVAARNEVKEAHAGFIDPQYHQPLVEGSSPALATEHEEATPFGPQPAQGGNDDVQKSMER